MSVYRIKEETLTNIANSIREFSPQGGCNFIADIVDGEGYLTREIEVFYTEFIDTPQLGYEGIEDGNHDFNFIRTGLGYNEELGMDVPVLYDDYDLSAADPHYYYGTVEIDGVIYDQWRKITQEFPWQGGICYKYTERIIEGDLQSGGGDVGPMTALEMPQKILNMNTAPYILYGSYRIRSNAEEDGYLPVNRVIWENDEDMDNGTVFYHGFNNYKDLIYRITIGPDSVSIYCEEQDIYYEDGEWTEDYDGESYPAFKYPGTGQIIFTVPKEVSPEFYIAFTQLMVMESGTHKARSMMKQAIEGTLSVYGGYHAGSYAMPDYAFMGLSTLIAANLRSCTMIGECAFYDCSSLKEITPIQGNIGSSAFGKCSQISSIHCTGNIGGYAFANCSGLTTAIIRNGEISNHAFAYCSKLSNITLVNPMNILQYAFTGCTSLLSIKISGSTVPIVHSSAFMLTPSSMCIYAPISNSNAYLQLPMWSSLYRAGKLVFY